MRDLLSRAATYGVSVHGAHLSGDKLGVYAPALGRIYFDLSLTFAERRSVIAHELGHVHYAHDGESPRNERLADAFAARLLVPPEWYAELEQVNCDAEWIAEEMNVAPWVIVDFRRFWLQRTEGATYAFAREGVRQWGYRAAV